MPVEVKKSESLGEEKSNSSIEKNSEKIEENLARIGALKSVKDEKKSDEGKNDLADTVIGFLKGVMNFISGGGDDQKGGEKSAAYKEAKDEAKGMSVQQIDDEIERLEAEIMAILAKDQEKGDKKKDGNDENTATKEAEGVKSILDDHGVREEKDPDKNASSDLKELSKELGDKTAER